MNPPKPPGSAPNPNLTRDHLANERTFLAWVRTSLGLIGLGFVLARMGLFLRQLASANLIHEGSRIRFQAGHEFLVSGVIFLVIGTAFCAWSLRRYRANQRAILSGEFDPPNTEAIALVALVVIGGLVIAGMVVWRTLEVADS
jgi:putative membrane protein